jgi:hypothetical protein
VVRARDDDRFVNCSSTPFQIRWPVCK